MNCNRFKLDACCLSHRTFWPKQRGKKNLYASQRPNKFNKFHLTKHKSKSILSKCAIPFNANSPSMNNIISRIAHKQLLANIQNSHRYSPIGCGAREML